MSSFHTSFERNVNNDMQDDGQPGRAPPEAEDADMAMKKGLPSPGYPIDEKAHSKNEYPPRFSTLFSAAPAPPPPPPPQREYIRVDYPEPQKKSGVFLPMPLFIVFAAILFIESTILFAYTVIGLYNNAPAKLFLWAGQSGAVAAACNFGPQQPAVNIAPNFIMPQAGQPLTDLITITPSTSIPTSTSSTSSSTSTSETSTSASTTSSSTTSSTTTDGAGEAASNIAGIFGSLELTTVSAVRPTVTSVKLITVDPPRPTTSTTVTIDAPAPTDS